MTSVFEVLPGKEILQTEELTKATSQDEHKETIARTKKKAEPISRRYFLICQTCFWCASYNDMDNMDELPYKAWSILEICNTCNDNRIESLPISYDECYRFEYTPTRGAVLEFLR
jgi:hypothetical protein